MNVFPQGQTVNQHQYNDILRRLSETLRQIRPKKMNSGDWFHHHENAPAHSALSVGELLAKNSMILVPHPPYSPDFAPYDSFLSPKLKMALKGMRFNDFTMIQEKSRDALAQFQTADFRKYFERWRDHWACCTGSKVSTLKGTS
jgi:histone-lysine N-methyltransferase SETMAR